MSATERTGTASGQTRRTPPQPDMMPEHGGNRHAFHRHAVQMGRLRHPATVLRTPEGGCRQRRASRLQAGDMGTPEKQAAGDAAVSRFAAGVDCSGFVSRCWRLDRPFSTRELPALCTRLPSWEDLPDGRHPDCAGAPCAPVHSVGGNRKRAGSWAVKPAPCRPGNVRSMCSAAPCWKTAVTAP